MTISRSANAYILAGVFSLLCACSTVPSNENANAEFDPNSGASAQTNAETAFSTQKVSQKEDEKTREQECTDAQKELLQYINNNGQKAEAIRIRVTGYGAPPKAFYPEAQRRLMSMRAAKIDAYRSLAERVNGVQIWGGTTIGDMVVEKDRFRVYLDTHLRGARVIAENSQEDGTYETVVEMRIGQDFLVGAIRNAAMKPGDPCASMLPVGTQIKPQLSIEQISDRDPNPAFMPVNKPNNGMISSDFYYNE
ncbi:MAG: LPP20 family lipoprotein [Gammaproteobacteria bacterium]|nr:LPP20 family lipoprotein [Gammaproteobacteria bacterium]MDH5731462.1 LPP20 family lipoprotein [Gammaproteobacteria bacterium]